jgi:hypothetical protein
MLVIIVTVFTSVEAAPREKRQLGAILGGLLGGGDYYGNLKIK